MSNVHAEVELPSTVPTQTEGFSGITSLSSIASIDSMQSELPVPTHNESAIDYAKQHGEDDESKISQDDEDIYGDPSPGDTTAGGDIVPKGVKLNTPQGDDDMYGMDAVTERETNGKELSSSDKSNRDIYQVGNGAGTTKGE